MKPTEDNLWPPVGDRWTVRLIGRLEVISPSNELVRFRSRTALSLLAFLSLNNAREFAGENLKDLFWPDSDGDRQAQNLRRAIADLRVVLEQDLPLGSVVVTRKGHVSLNSEKIATDVDRFVALTSAGPTPDEQDNLTQAVSLYSGALLAPLAEPWVAGPRLDLEERFGQAVVRLCEILVRQGKTKEAIRIGRFAILAAPLREDIHVALITAYNEAGLESEAIRQFEELERLLDETFGERPSERSKQALERRQAATAAAATLMIGNGTEPEPSGGAMPLQSKLYVRRQVDAEVQTLIDRAEGVVLLQGPRQVGKSSLLARALEHARSSQVAVVLCDLQSMGESQLTQEGLFYRTVAQSFADQLGLDFDVDSVWRSWFGSNMNLDAVFARLLAQTDRRVCWALDEADLLFDRHYTNDFFGLLRSWHNRRALEPHGPWAKLTMIVSYATEANLFISDINQSPFNVGVRLALRDFCASDVEQLGKAYGQASRAGEVYALTRGHPFLTQCSFAFLNRGGGSEELVRSASRPDGVFGQHLKRMLVSIKQSDQMLAETQRLLRGEPFADPTTRYRLQSAGLISLSADGRAEFRVPAYESFLRQELG